MQNVKTMTESYSTSTAYRTLEEIRMRKALLLKDIQKDSDRMDHQWHSLFQRPRALGKAATPSKRIGSVMNMGAGLLDGVLLAWKLYRKFKK